MNRREEDGVLEMSEKGIVYSDQYPNHDASITSSRAKLAGSVNYATYHFADKWTETLFLQNLLHVTVLKVFRVRK